MNTILQVLKLRSNHLSHLRHQINFLYTTRCLVSRGFHEVKIFESESRLNRPSAGFVTPPSQVFQVCKRNYGTKAPKKDGKHKKGSKPKVTLTDEEIKAVINIESFRERVSKRVEKLKDDYLKHVTIRTSAGSIESLLVNFEGQEYPLNQIAQISRKNQNLFVLNLTSNPEAIRAVLEAVQKSGLGLNPQQEGNTLYLPIPPVTREYRENLVKNAKSLFTQAKDDIQAIQNQTIKVVKNKNGHFSEDLIFNIQQQIIFETEGFITQAESVFTKKEADLLGGK